ncbi:hypothetical protein GJAV_G00237480 [Gymnothorax javanicus]|nr:hypothetical protein GJAV_G00237480 [Gymnothorax javanicus]
MPPRRRPTSLPEGYLLTDTEKKQWRLGKIIGSGGFGQIYLASRRLDAPVPDDSDFVIKVEYHENGPLFCELKFYQRAAKPDCVDQWSRKRALDFVGIPRYFASGSAEYNGKRYRFMVMDRLGTDLQKFCEKNGGRLKRLTVLRLGYLLLDALEYVHDNEYVHADIKAANVMLGYRDPSQVYLADFGLAYRYCPDGTHKEYKENPRKGHNGTIEYTSIDAHKGVAPSRRGDLEVLGYCLLHWLCGRLPWDTDLKKPLMVQEAKAKLMANLPDSVLELAPCGTCTVEVARFLLHVRTLGYNEKPDYQALRSILEEGRPKSGRREGPLDFSRPTEEREERRPPPNCVSKMEPPCARTARPARAKPVARVVPKPRAPPREEQLRDRAQGRQRKARIQPRNSPQEEERKKPRPRRAAVRQEETHAERVTEERRDELNREDAPPPRGPYNLRDRPPRGYSAPWGSRHWSGALIILFFLFLALLFVLLPHTNRRAASR